MWGRRHDCTHDKRNAEINPDQRRHPDVTMPSRPYPGARPGSANIPRATEVRSRQENSIIDLSPCVFQAIGPQHATVDVTKPRFLARQTGRREGSPPRDRCSTRPRCRGSRYQRRTRRTILPPLLLHVAAELWPKVGEGVNRGRRHIVGVFEPPLLHRRSDMPCSMITLSN